MEANATVKGLIDTIKKEGIQEANRQGEDIIREAQKKAEDIVLKARKEAERIVNDAKENAEKMKLSGEKALTQAGRNLIISLKQQITELFKKVTEAQVTSAFTPEVIKDVIIKIIENWDMTENFPGIEVLVDKKDLKKLEEALVKSLSEEWKNGVILKPVDNIQAGFQIGEKDGNVHYNFTSKGISEILSEYLNPQIAKFLEAGAEE